MLSLSVCVFVQFDKELQLTCCWLHPSRWSCLPRAWRDPQQVGIRADNQKTSACLLDSVGCRWPAFGLCIPARAAQPCWKRRKRGPSPAAEGQHPNSSRERGAVVPAVCAESFPGHGIFAAWGGCGGQDDDCQGWTGRGAPTPAAHLAGATWPF